MDFDKYDYRVDTDSKIIVRNRETGCEFFRKLSLPVEQISYYHFEILLSDSSEILRCEVTEKGKPWAQHAKELGLDWQDFQDASEFTKTFGNEFTITSMDMPWSHLDTKEINFVWGELVRFFNAKKFAFIHLNEQKARTNLSCTAFKKRDEYYSRNPPRFTKTTLLFRPIQLNAEHWKRVENREEDGMYVCN